jgi:hypothetical protein
VSAPRWIGLLVALAVAAGATPALARPRKAERGLRGGKVATRSDNLPRGFTWPPSAAMREAEAACERALDASPVVWAPARPEGHVADPIAIDDGLLGGVSYVASYGGPMVMDCQLALALQAIGPALVAAGVREVRYGSIYRWSNVRVMGKTKHVLSRHALGLAMDVVSFVDDGGREARVGRDYRQGDALLRAVEDAINTSGWFRLVLTPKNDPLSHKDHFHLEANPRYAVAPSDA